MAPSSTQQLLEREEVHAPRRRGTFWTVLAAAEVVLATVAVLLNLTSFPTFVILALAGISLAVRREGLATLGFRRVPHFWRMAAGVLGLVVGWSLLSLGLLRPVLNHLTGTTEDLSQYADLQGNLGMLAGLLLTFLDALFFSVLRLRYRTLWAPILAHGFWNTLGIVGFFLVGPVHGFW